MNNTNPLTTTFCAIPETFGCGTVSRTPVEISVVILAKNEEKNIAVVLPQILETVRRSISSPWEIFLVDGYSQDNTVKITEEFGVRVIKAGGGKGRGIRSALEASKGVYVLFMDADSSHIPEDIPRLFETIRQQRCDMVIASRILGGSEELGMHKWDDCLRLWGNRIGTYLINLRWGATLTDVQNGFRILRRNAALELDLEEETFAIEQEMVMKCLKRGKRIVEIPGFERKRLHGESKICKRKEFWKYLWCLIKNL